MASLVESGFHGQSAMSRLVDAFEVFRLGRNYPQKDAHELLLIAIDKKDVDAKLWLEDFLIVWDSVENDENFSTPVSIEASPEALGFRMDPRPAFKDRAPEEVQAAHTLQKDDLWVIWDPEFSPEDGLFLAGRDPKELIDRLPAAMMKFSSGLDM